MAKIDTFNVEGKLAPFTKELGVMFNEVVSDCKSLVGDAAGENEKNILTKSTGWEAGTKGRFTSKDGLTLQLPLNNPLTILMSFGAQLSKIAKAGSLGAYNMSIEAEIPVACLAWFTEKSRKFHARKQASTAAAAVTE